jgi:hypothetical protein
MNEWPVLSSFPSRPLSLTEINALEDRESIQSIVADDITAEDSLGPELSSISVSSCVIVRAETVVAAVFVDSEKAWYRAYSAARPGVELAEAYEIIRSFRGEETLFASAPLSSREAVHRANLEQKKMANNADYVKGDTFECPVCSETHTVRRRNDDPEVQFPEEDRLYVNCPDAESGTLTVY